jgi:hypothetical protein
MWVAEVITAAGFVHVHFCSGADADSSVGLSVTERWSKLIVFGNADLPKSCWSEVRIIKLSTGLLSVEAGEAADFANVALRSRGYHYVFEIHQA